MAIRVLMIDDSIVGRDMLRHQLECLGCEIVGEAENTLQALDLFRTIGPDLVTLDVAVARTGGIGALALFRIMRTERPAVRILVASALTFPEVRKAFLSGNAIDYLVKPLDAASFERIRLRLNEAFPDTHTGLRETAISLG